MARKRDENADDYPLLVFNILGLTGLTQAELARRAGKRKGQVHAWIRGKKTPRPANLRALVEGGALPSSFVAEALPHVRGIRAAAGRVPESPVGDDPAAETAAQLAGAVEQAARSAAKRLLAELHAEERQPDAPPGPPSPEDRAEADRLWRAFEDLPQADLEILAENLPELQTWAFAERLAHESERAAPKDVERALALALLAVRVAGRISGEASWCSRVEGYVWAFLGNARRAGNDAAGAEGAFGEHERRWGPAEADPAGLLDESRVTDLKASLRRAQRRFDEALRLHDQALALCPPAQRPVILLNQSATLEQKGDHEAALAALRKAAHLVDEAAEPRLACVLRFNLAVLLCHRGRAAEAEPLAAEARDLAARLDTDLDQIRVRWLEGKVAAGLGRAEEAIERLRGVQAEFIARKMPYDTALATLELAALLAGRGETAEVQALAKLAAPLFKVQGVHREALACFLLFEEAAEREAVTAALARTLAERLRQGA